MPTVVSSIILVAIMQVQPYPVIRALDRFPDVGQCDARIALVKDYEKDKPKSDQIANRLQCISMEYVSDYDGDGPAPNKVVPNGPAAVLPKTDAPSKVDVPHTAYPCRNPITKGVLKCKDASFLSQ